MLTQCNSERCEFPSLNSRIVTADFEGGDMTSDGGVALLAEVDRTYRVIERLAVCFTDHRDAERIEHPVLDLLRQRIYGLCCGYEDLHDHDRLRMDKLLAAAIGKDDPQGNDRRREADRGIPLAGKSTLNRTSEFTGFGNEKACIYVCRQNAAVFIVNIKSCCLQIRSIKAGQWIF